MAWTVLASINSAHLIHFDDGDGASWSITKHVKAYLILFLLLEPACWCLMALDFFLFYIFWE